MRNFLILSFVITGCAHAPKFPEGEVGAMEQKTQTMFVYKTPKSIEGQFEYIRDDQLSQWNGGYCVKPEYFNQLHNYSRDLKNYLEKRCKCQ